MSKLRIWGVERITPLYSVSDLCHKGWNGQACQPDRSCPTARMRLAVNVRYLSREHLYRNGEDYTGAVCFLLPKSQATLIDAELFDWASQFTWHVMGSSVFYYDYMPARRVGRCRYPGKRTMHVLHRLAILQGVEAPRRWQIGRAMASNHIDHVNRNPWDNRRANLRVATPSQNNHNRGPKPKASSKYKGVSWNKDSERWVAIATLKKKTHYLGSFKDEFKAAQAYNAFIRKRCPEFGYINPLSIDGQETAG